ncbi:DUF3299 domain-containing protein [Thalassotalea fonticola]|uniref:DUF3299 domain-containing protein n=1 Tax=Thalassotalea fonticola TaxID=3065649 RepID=A0ABZ0GT25_9GAMM|nr:DUF3299 domain-containing protein [Colwelliaceae bacterium S1-1]
MLFLLCIFFSATNVMANQVVDLHWKQLLPAKSSFEDPFKQLNANQLETIGYVVGMRNRIQTLKTSADADKPEMITLINNYTERLNDALSHLEQDSIDLDYLLSQRSAVMKHREQQATAIAPRWINQSVSISGFALPVSIKNGLLTEFFMIEMSPALSIGHDHKAPKPNQTILIKYPQGIKIKNGETKITVSGHLSQQWFNKEIVLADNHKTEYEAAYQLVADKITFD